MSKNSTIDCHRHNQVNMNDEETNRLSQETNLGVLDSLIPALDIWVQGGRKRYDKRRNGG